jgi:hypothetical protein
MAYFIVQQAGPGAGEDADYLARLGIDDHPATQTARRASDLDAPLPPAYADSGGAPLTERHRAGGWPNRERSASLASAKPGTRAESRQRG